MPITFLPNPNGPALGVGIQVSFSSDFIGPLPVGSQWVIEFLRQGQEGTPWISGTQATQSPFNGRYTPLIDRLNTNWQTTTNVQHTLGQGVNAQVNVQLQTPTGTVDSGSLQATWDSTSGLGLQIEQQAGAQGGFTAADRTQLQAIEKRSQTIGEPEQLVIQGASGPATFTLAELFSRQTLDRLTLQELTSGETCEPVRVNIQFSWFHAIIVRVTRIASDLVAKTPDQEWYFPDLAVLRVFRGADLEYRRGIHTPTFIQEKPWQWGWQFLNVVPILGTPPETIVAVDWREGCCGRVYGMFLN